MSRPRSTGGILDQLIRKVTDNDMVYELADRVGATVRSVYLWDQGKNPERYFQLKLNELCEEVGLEKIYSLESQRGKALRNGVRGATVVGREKDREKGKNNGKKRNQRH